MTNNNPLLSIRGLRASAGDLEILNGIDLEVYAGEVHAIMGPNGSGKSTLANVLAGRPDYTVTGGQAIYDGEDLLSLEPEIRARMGVFLAFQYPVELPGVRAWQFLKAGVDARRVHNGEEELSAREFQRLLDQKVKQVEIDPELVRRAVNEGFSGGEKKRNEILQMAVLEPKLALLRRDRLRPRHRCPPHSLRRNQQASQRRKTPWSWSPTTSECSTTSALTASTSCWTAEVVRSGGPELALELEERGYDWVREETDKS